MLDPTLKESVLSVVIHNQNKPAVDYMLILLEELKKPAHISTETREVAIANLDPMVLLKLFYISMSYVMQLPVRGKTKTSFLEQSKRSYRFSAELAAYFMLTTRQIASLFTRHADPVLSGSAKEVIQHMDLHRKFNAAAAVLMVNQLTIKNTKFKPTGFLREKKVDDFLPDNLKEDAGRPKQKTGKPAKKNKKKKQAPNKQSNVHTPVEPSIEQGFAKVSEHYLENTAEVLNFYRRILAKRKYPDKVYALVGCAKCLDFFTDNHKARGFVTDLEIASDNIFNEAKSYIHEDDIDKHRDEFKEVVTRWRASQPSDIVVPKPVVEPLLPPPKPTIRKNLWTPRVQTSGRMVVPQQHDYVRKSLMAEMKRPFTQQSVMACEEREDTVAEPDIQKMEAAPPKTITLLQRPQDVFARIRVDYPLDNIEYTPSQDAVMNLLELEGMDPCSHGGMVFDSYFKIKPGDLDLFCFAAEKSILVHFLKAHKEVLKISDVHENLKTDVIVITFDSQLIKNEVRKKSDLKLEILFIKDTGDRCQDLKRVAAGFGMIFLGYDRRRHSILDPGGLFPMLKDYGILAFQIAAGDCTAYMCSYPERILDNIKRLARNERAGIPLKLQKSTWAAMRVARSCLLKPFDKYNMEKFNRLFMSGYAEQAASLLVKSDCLPFLFPKLCPKFYAHFEKSCNSIDMLVRQLDMDKLPEPKFEGIRAMFLANILCDSFVASYDLRHYHQNLASFNHDCQAFIESCAFDMRFSQETMVKTQEIIWNRIQPVIVSLLAMRMTSAF